MGTKTKTADVASSCCKSDQISIEGLGSHILDAIEFLQYPGALLNIQLENVGAVIFCQLDYFQ